MSFPDKTVSLEMKEPLFREKNSTMMSIIHPQKTLTITHSFFDILNQIDDFSIASVKMPEETDTPFGTVTYQYGEVYRFFLFQAHEFHSQFETIQLEELDEKSKQNLQDAHEALTIILPFSHELQQSYQLQVKIFNLLVPDMVCLVDENAQRILSPQEVTMICRSQYLPDPTVLFSIQAVHREDKIWLHTHGLIRCQLTELEILNANKDTHYDFYYLIKALATQLIYTRLEEPENHFNPTQILGEFFNQQPIISHTMTWNQAIKYYPAHALGGSQDRQHDHNTFTSLIFILKINEHEEKLVSPDKISSFFAKDPLYFTSGLEIKRSKSVAHEQFPALLTGFKQFHQETTWVPLVKIAIPHGENDKENLWFQLIELTHDMLIGKSTQ